MGAHRGLASPGDPRPVVAAFVVVVVVVAIVVVVVGVVASAFEDAVA